MARSKKKRRGGNRKKRRTNKPKSNTIPLDVLEKRLGKLNRIVLKRGGNAYQ